MYFNLSKYPLGTFNSTNFVTFLVLLQFSIIYIIYNYLKLLSYNSAIAKINRLFSFNISFCRNIKVVNYFILFVVIILYEIYFRILGVSLLDARGLSPVDIKLLSGKSPISYILIKGFADTLVGTWIFVISYFVLTKKKYYTELICIMMFIFYVAFFTGSRGLFVFGTIIPFLKIYNAYKNKLSIQFLIFLFVCILFFIGILGILRASHEGMSLDFILNTILNSHEKIQYLVLSILDRRLDSFYPNLMHVFDNADKFSFRYGFDYLNIFLQYIPRFIWEDKPLSLVREANNILVLQDVGGTGFSSIFEAWFNFGPFGLIINGIIASFFLVFFQKLYINSKNNHNLFVLIFSLTLGVSLILRMFISPGISHNSAELLFKITFFYISYLFIKYSLKFRL